MEKAKSVWVARENASLYGGQCSGNNQTYKIKDVRAKMFHSIDCLKFLLQSDTELLVSQMQTTLEVTDFVSDIKRVENDPDFEKLAHIIQHGLQGLQLKISKVSQRRQMLPTFSQNLTLQEVFKTVAQINEDKKNGIRWCVSQKIQTSNR